MSDANPTGNGSPPAHRPESGRAYDPRAIELRRQRGWEAHDAFRTPMLKAEQSGVYIKASAPFTSGNVHIGHVRSYAIGDAYARFQRARGEPVLFAFGFDAFGLPAELGAIANGESPAEWVSRCAEHMTGQLRRLGFSFDWERTFMSSDAVMYRWSQWLFLTLLDAGLIYHGSGSVDWCDTCQTTLATIQVEDGACWRCHNPVRLIQRPQWYLRISAYLEENDRRLGELRKWDDTSLASQRLVLGRVDGVELQARAEDGRELTVFTPHADGIAKARFVLISPKHPEIERWVAGGAVAERLEEMRLGGWERSTRGAEAVALVNTGVGVTLAQGDPSPSSPPPLLPLLISPAVDERYGATAVLGIPDLDRTDGLIAQRLGLAGAGGKGKEEEGRGSSRPAEAGSAAAAGAGDAAGVGRDAVHGDTLAATVASADDPAARARPAVRYKAGDFSISRQRSWGTPIPIVYCERCDTVPVPVEQLPVELPRDLKPTGEGNPLAEREEFVNTACPRCGGAARRETDTLDCHFDALWLWIPACVPAPERERTLEEILALEDLRAWLPSERLVAGSDSGNFMFDQRITTKALRDIGPLAFLADGEPFAGALMHEMVIRDGRKMSKHLGNVVDPDELVERFGADTVRLAVLWAARPQKSLNWSDSAVQFCQRFLHNLWQYSHSHARFAQAPSEDGERDPRRTEHLRRRLEKWCDTAVEKITKELADLEMHSAVRNVIRLLDRVKDYEKRVIQHSGALCREDHEALIDALGLIATMLIPFAPHIGMELWEASGLGAPGCDTAWPAPGEWSRQPPVAERPEPLPVAGGEE
ncbi:MAG TPA: class I tRNA ligase family protein [Solirubrobacteraceae bacterium]|jgi:leucyl-tRNA synthetase|nr:class I tRNA ligase family protein [Solirubrobacteraceae bacterium]